jgi:hypothetical protein
LGLAWVGFRHLVAANNVIVQPAAALPLLVAARATQPDLLRDAVAFRRCVLFMPAGPLSALGALEIVGLLGRLWACAPPKAVFF